MRGGPRRGSTLLVPDLVRLRPVFDLQGLIDRHRVAAMRYDPGTDHATRVCESARPRTVTGRRVLLLPHADQVPISPVGATTRPRSPRHVNQVVRIAVRRRVKPGAYRQSFSETQIGMPADTRKDHSRPSLSATVTQPPRVACEPMASMVSLVAGSSSLILRSGP